MVALVTTGVRDTALDTACIFPQLRVITMAPPAPVRGPTRLSLRPTVLGGPWCAPCPLHIELACWTGTATKRIREWGGLAASPGGALPRPTVPGSACP